jgi:hypothetical protein
VDYRDKPPSDEPWVKIQSAKPAKVGQDSAGVDSISKTGKPTAVASATQRKSIRLAARTGASSLAHRVTPASSRWSIIAILSIL